MAEIQIRPTAGAGYGAGDLVRAHNGNRISHQWAQRICHPRRNQLGANGLYAPGSIVEAYFFYTRPTLYERISRTELRVTKPGESYVLSNVKDAKGRRCNVPALIAHGLVRRQDGHPARPMFGTPGAEYWYGGPPDFGNEQLDLVWAGIEAKTSHRKVDYPRWPFSDRELRSFLVLSVEDFDVSARREYELRLADGRPKYSVNWQALPTLDNGLKADILNRAVAVDIRERIFPLSILQVKS